MKHLTAIALGLSVLAGAPAAAAGPGLQNEDDINNGLLIMAAADKIRRECDSISPRLGRAHAYKASLEKMATDRGYSQSEIDAYVNNDVEKMRVRERRNTYFQSRGASNLDAESLCVLGRAEISAGSQIGLLLKAK